MRHTPLLLLFLFTLLPALTPAYGQGRPSPYPLPSAPVELETYNATVKATVVAQGIPRPFGFEVLPNGDILITDRYSPALRVIQGNELIPEPMQGLPPVRTGFHSGLLDVVAHPQFSDNQLIYLTYHVALDNDGEYAIALGRGRYDGSTELKDFEQLFEGTPMTISGGSRMAFAPDGKLFVTVGGAMDRRPLAQDLSRLEGKVLRLNENGTIPADNPFIDHADAHPAIYSYGHRDQLPREGYESAILIWQPGIVPSGLLFYTGEAFPQWQGQMLAGSIQRGRIPGTGGLERVVFDNLMQEVQRETMVTELRQRIRDVSQGPDGAIYLLTEEENGAVIKLEPAS